MFPLSPKANIGGAPKAKGGRGGRGQADSGRSPQRFCGSFAVDSVVLDVEPVPCGNLFGSDVAAARPCPDGPFWPTDPLGDRFKGRVHGDSLRRQLQLARRVASAAAVSPSASRIGERRNRAADSVLGGAPSLRLVGAASLGARSAYGLSVFDAAHGAKLMGLSVVSVGCGRIRKRLPRSGDQIFVIEKPRQGSGLCLFRQEA